MWYLRGQILEGRREKVDLKYTIAVGLWFNSPDLNYIGFFKEYSADGGSLQRKYKQTYKQTDNQTETGNSPDINYIGPCKEYVSTEGGSLYRKYIHTYIQTDR